MYGKHERGISVAVSSVDRETSFQQYIRLLGRVYKVQGDHTIQADAMDVCTVRE